MDLLAAVESVRYVHIVLLTLLLRETQEPVAKNLHSLIKREKRGKKTPTINLLPVFLYLLSNYCPAGCPKKHFI